MKNVMKKAWEIARNGQKKFGGKVSEYLSVALKMAWAIIKKGANKVSKYPNVVAKRAEELLKSGDQPTKQFAVNKAELEFEELIRDLKKMNAAKVAQGQEPASIEEFKRNIDDISVKQYLDICMRASYAAKYL